MKKRLHDKKAGIAILIALIIISVAEVIYRAIVIGKAVLTTSNLGEQLTVIALAVTILILTAKGKDRACYICYGAWIAYFVLDHIFELPGTLISFLSDQLINKPNIIGSVGPICQILSFIGVITLGALLIEYMNDGTIYNRAFNVISIITVSLIVASLIGDAFILITAPMMKEIMADVAVNTGFKPEELVLASFNNIYRLTMIFMFTFFAYDSAKAQLKKINPAK